MKALCTAHATEAQSALKAEGEGIDWARIPEEVMYWYFVGKAFEADGRVHLEREDCPACVCAVRCPTAMTSWKADVAR